MSTAAEITTEPVKISPYTIGTGVPALDVFCTPAKLNDNCGSSSELNFCGSGKGNNISLTPVRSKATPIFPTVAMKALGAAPVAIKPKPPIPKANPAPGAAIAIPIKTAPSNIFPIPLPAPLITGIKCMSCLPTGWCISSSFTS